MADWNGKTQSDLNENFCFWFFSESRYEFDVKFLQYYEILFFPFSPFCWGKAREGIKFHNIAEIWHLIFQPAISYYEFQNFEATFITSETKNSLEPNFLQIHLLLITCWIRYFEFWISVSKSVTLLDFWSAILNPPFSIFHFDFGIQSQFIFEFFSCIYLFYSKTSFIGTFCFSSNHHSLYIVT